MNPYRRKNGFFFVRKHMHKYQRKIRRIMYWAHQYKWDCQMFKKFN